ncbi:hypothetical protein NSND_60923 [Nitrospira sp. ND1]|nr:hypothetical protein NSND_60923 [Nitrospira sp. ND1]
MMSKYSSMRISVMTMVTNMLLYYEGACNRIIVKVGGGLIGLSCGVSKDAFIVGRTLTTSPPRTGPERVFISLGFMFE